MLTGGAGAGRDHGRGGGARRVLHAHHEEHQRDRPGEPREEGHEERRLLHPRPRSQVSSTINQT